MTKKQVRIDDAVLQKILVPLAVALITGLLAGIAVWRYLPGADALGVGALLSLGAWIAQWVLSLSLDRLERLVGMDLNGDGRIGKQPPSIKAPLPQVAYQSDSELLLAGAQAGRPLAQESWVPRPFSRSRYLVARDALIKSGQVEWKNPNAHGNGLRLTRAGGAVHEVRVFQKGQESTFVM